MRIIIAPDSYKGSVSAAEVADAIEKGFLKVFPEAEIIKIPIADGGEGTVQALVRATKGTLLPETVKGPLGEPLRAHWGILGDGKTAIIEMAAASGLPLVPVERRNPLVTCSYGTGQLIKAALDRGLRRIIVGIGGSATNDGGAGMARALGARFLDAGGKELPPGGAALRHLSAIDLRDLDPRLEESEVIVACDVDNPLYGPRGASAVFGPQKAASPEMVEELDAALRVFADVARKVTGRDVSDQSGAGAAGGLGAGLMWFAGAILRPGVEIVLEVTGFESHVSACDLVVTGEGKTDFQTAFGKAPVGVAKVAQRHNKPVICLSGGLGKGAEEVLRHGIDCVMSVVPGPMNLEECMARGAELIEEAAARVACLLKCGMKLGG
jgi:glycerate kinase